MYMYNVSRPPQNQEYRPVPRHSHAPHQIGGLQHFLGIAESHGLCTRHYSNILNPTIHLLHFCVRVSSTVLKLLRRRGTIFYFILQTCSHITSRGSTKNVWHTRAQECDKNLQQTQKSHMRRAITLFT